MKTKMKKRVMVFSAVGALVVLVLLIAAYRMASSDMSVTAAPQQKDGNWLWDEFQSSKDATQKSSGTAQGVNAGATTSAQGTMTSTPKVSQALGGGKVGTPCSDPPPDCPSNAFQECVLDKWQCIVPTAAPDAKAPNAPQATDKPVK